MATTSLSNFLLFFFFSPLFQLEIFEKKYSCCQLIAIFNCTHYCINTNLNCLVFTDLSDLIISKFEQFLNNKLVEYITVEKKKAEEKRK